jgi:hypothetical protein
VVALSIAAGVARAVGRLPSGDWHVRPAWIVASFAALALFQLIHADVWRRMLGALGSPLPLGPAVGVWSASLLGRYVPASALMPVIRVGLGRDCGVPGRVVGVTIVYELLLTFASSILLGAYGLASLPQLAGHSYRYAFLLAPVAVLAVLHPRVLERVLALAARRLGRPGLEAVLPLRTLAACILQYAAGFVVAGLGVACFAAGLQPIHASDVAVLAMAYPVGFAFSLLAFVAPGGLGARELALAAVAATVVPAALAAAAAVGTRLLQIGVELAYTAAARRWVVARTAAVAAPAAARREEVALT